MPYGRERGAQAHGTSNRSPMRRGLKFPERLHARTDFRQTSNRSPMRRGLKLITLVTPLDVSCHFKPIPDEEGTEIGERGCRG